MSNINQSSFKIEKLKQTRSFIRRMIAERDDGESYLAIHDSLEREIKEIASKESAIQRIRQLAREEQEALISS